MTHSEKIIPLPSERQGKTYQLFVRDLVLEGRIGIYGHEKIQAQRVKVNLSIECQEHPPIDDNYANAICYAELVADIRELVEADHINLVETLAERIASRSLRDPRVLWVKVRVEKLDAIPEAAGIGVEIERRRPGFSGAE